ncbi:SAM-dependent methyltransferase [Dissulfuribacter thermophilus]|uniref:SAM-dependent methyltransferase n=1 Tax=Dissulfuribacter thermophilus TaxID=1156395 RepID=A0A1B9F8M4_9BACT|nr:DUF5714 domain-containing protein [Dissulfuribacter thermophilus]OCC16131.1 SAM-dependent methyltransferase [Dissulfuribacter thermophilus]
MPFWFVVNERADTILKDIQKLCEKEIVRSLINFSIGPERAFFEARHFLGSITIPPVSPYEGRKGKGLEGLRELWFHLLDRCNLSCRHCLFSEFRARNRTLKEDTVKKAIKKAIDHGLNVVCFTGGEPFLYPHFDSILRYCMDIPNLKIAVLTNGLLCQDLLKDFSFLKKDRIHFQVSLEGPKDIHDSIRGKGSFDRAKAGIESLIERGFSVTCAMSVNKITIHHIKETLHILKDLGITGCHLLWHFDQGAGTGLSVSEDELLIENFASFLKEADCLGIEVDNLDAIRSQVFSPPGTRYDLGSAGWESLCVGPDGKVWPTPATVDRPGFLCGELLKGGEDLLDIWKTSPKLEEIRSLSLIDSQEMREDPWHFLTGGGDIDHCLEPLKNHEGFSLNPDPNSPFYEAMIQYAIKFECNGLPKRENNMGVVLKMGDVSFECHEIKDVNFLHSNCLLSMGQGDQRGLVQEFYSRRVKEPDKKIQNPTLSGIEGINFVPKANIERSYGCGSPVEDALLQAGEYVCDLGCGTGVECLIAAKKVGPSGRVIGLDMTDEMLKVANEGKHSIVKGLGYDNISFIKAHLEDIPIESGTLDCIISNCVLNLTKNKRRVLKEAFRCLKPGGRIVISDVVTECEPMPWIRGNKVLVGECLGGALVQSYLFSMLRDLGFEHSKIIKRFPYREVSGHRFYSLTFEAKKPLEDRPKEKKINALLKGPIEGLFLKDGTLLTKGTTKGISHDISEDLPDDLVLKIDPHSGEALNQLDDGSCSCCSSPNLAQVMPKERIRPKQPSGCLLCGAPIVYLDTPVKLECDICGTVFKTQTRCIKGHFCCDSCHVEEPLEVIRELAINTTETDMISLMKRIRTNPRFPMHGPEHHAMVPGIILATYKNLGGDIGDEKILAAIEKGSKVPGGACGFMGSCGAAIGVGVAFSVLLDSSPLSPRARSIVQKIVGEVLLKIGERVASRCCQRESYIALKEAKRFSEKYLDINLVADHDLICTQYDRNRECIKRACCLYPSKKYGLKGVSFL